MKLRFLLILTLVGLSQCIAFEDKPKVWQCESDDDCEDGTICHSRLLICVKPSNGASDEGFDENDADE